MQDQKCILLVDDEPLLLASLQAVLIHNGYAVEAQATAQGAFHALRTLHIDLVIMDLTLPDAGGMCLIAMSRRLYPRLPVLVLTGNASIDTTLQAIRLGARGYLVKPVAPEQVLFCIQQIFAEKPNCAHKPKRTRPARVRRKMFAKLGS